MLRVLKVSPSDPLLWSKQLRNYEVSQRQIYIYIYMYMYLNSHTKGNVRVV